MAGQKSTQALINELISLGSPSRPVAPHMQTLADYLIGSPRVTRLASYYRPGEKVPKSGIYKVVHDTIHREEHEVTCVMGEVFPPCNHCGHHPQFTLVRAAHHIGNHEHFK